MRGCEGVQLCIVSLPQTFAMTIAQIVCNNYLGNLSTLVCYNILEGSGGGGVAVFL